ncbi:MAG: YjfB family protein [Clostridia bacterium]|nr:YjfB family protein [Clostridia bacterium]
MNIGSIPLESLSSIKQALNIATLRKSMNQDAQSVSLLLNDMKNANAKVMEQSVTPHKGSHVDIKV